MADSLEFKSWLIQPGNYRVFQQVKRQLAGLFKQDLEMKSWPDIYHWFEVSIDRTEDAIKWFAPILHDNPPSPEKGATPKQMMLYRGAYANPNAEIAPSKPLKTPVTYRGQVITPDPSATSEIEEPAQMQSEATRAPKYYRGVRVDDSE